MADDRHEKEDYSQDVVPYDPGTVAPDGSAAERGARFCNFHTGSETPLHAHYNWIDTNIKSLIKTLRSPQVDIYGYASHLGHTTGYDNQSLSMRRCVSIMNYLEDKDDTSLFRTMEGEGDTLSTGGMSNDDGFWRAVEIYVFASKPPPPPGPGPCTGFIRKPFSMRLTSYKEKKKGFSKVGKVGGVQAKFEIIDKNAGTSAEIFYDGVGLGFSGFGTPKADGPATSFIVRTPCSHNVTLDDFLGRISVGFSGQSAFVNFHDHKEFFSQDVLVHQTDPKLKEWGILQLSTGGGFNFQTFFPTEGEFRKTPLLDD